jgi:hypothetical protein
MAAHRQRHFFHQVRLPPETAKHHHNPSENGADEPEIMRVRTGKSSYVTPESRYLHKYKERSIKVAFACG